MHTIFAAVAAVETSQVDAFQRVRAGAVPQASLHLSTGCRLLLLHGVSAHAVLLVQRWVLYSMYLRNSTLGRETEIMFSIP